MSALLAASLLLLRAVPSEPQIVRLALVPSGIVRHMGGYPSIQVALTTKRPIGLKRLPSGVHPSLYGQLRLGHVRFDLMLGTMKNVPKLYIDSNRDGDLSDDPRATWSSTGGEGQVSLSILGSHRRCSLLFARSGTRSLIAIPDFGLAGSLKLGTAQVPFLLVDGGNTGFDGDNPSGGVIGFDRRGTGLISGPAEQYPAERPFTINGDSFVLSKVDLAGGTATFTPGEAVAEIPLPRILSAKQLSPTFTSVALDQRPVHFPADFSQSVVLVYAWASWSKPSLETRSRIEKVYEAERDHGFTVLGICLNRKDEIASAKADAATMPWTTCYDGKSWRGDAAHAFSLDTIPFLLLVNGKTGKIIATMNDLAGDQLESTIRASLTSG